MSDADQGPLQCNLKLHCRTLVGGGGSGAEFLHNSSPCKAGKPTTEKAAAHSSLTLSSLTLRGAVPSLPLGLSRATHIQSPPSVRLRPRVPVTQTGVSFPPHPPSLRTKHEVMPSSETAVTQHLLTPLCQCWCVKRSQSLLQNVTPNGHSMTEIQLTNCAVSFTLSLLSTAELS